MKFFVLFSLDGQSDLLKALPRVVIRARAIPGFVNVRGSHWARCHLTTENCLEALALVESLQGWTGVECWLDGQSLTDAAEVAHRIRQEFDLDPTPEGHDPS